MAFAAAETSLAGGTTAWRDSRGGEAARWVSKLALESKLSGHAFSRPPRRPQRPGLAQGGWRSAPHRKVLLLFSRSVVSASVTPGTEAGRAALAVTLLTPGPWVLSVSRGRRGRLEALAEEPGWEGRQLGGGGRRVSSKGKAATLEQQQCVPVWGSDPLTGDG